MFDNFMTCPIQRFQDFSCRSSIRIGIKSQLATAALRFLSCCAHASLIPSEPTTPLLVVAHGRLCVRQAASAWCVVGATWEAGRLYDLVCLCRNELNLGVEKSIKRGTAVPLVF